MHVPKEFRVFEVGLMRGRACRVLRKVRRISCGRFHLRSIGMLGPLVSFNFRRALGSGGVIMLGQNILRQLLWGPSNAGARHCQSAELVQALQ